VSYRDDSLGRGAATLDAQVTSGGRALTPVAGPLDRARPRVVALEVGELLAYEFPAQEPLLAPWLRKQTLAMVHAWRGIGKTHFALGVAYAVASGSAFLKWRADRPRKVLYIDGEMPGAAIKERLAAIIASPDGEQEPPPGHFRIVTPDAQEWALPDLATADGQADYSAVLSDAEVIVIDNLSALSRTGPENEGESWLPIANWALARRREGRAVLFVHHEGKNGQQRGSSRREDC
jgi:RecA-family ATPase